MVDIAIIGGTGLESLPAGFLAEPMTVVTHHGPATVLRASRDGRSIAFVSRHGEEHGTAPHRVNYRANISALAALGVKRVLATNAVGSLRADVPPGSLVLLDDFIDLTRSRPTSLWDGIRPSDGQVAHTDFSVPYCPTLRQAVMEAAQQSGVHVRPKGVYLCTEGPRFETPAEVRLFASWGADVVGMTGLPEAVYAREAGLCYAALAIVTNWAAGLTTAPVSHTDVLERMGEQAGAVRELLIAAGALAGECSCCV